MPGPFPFKQIIAADPSNPAMVARNGEVLLFAPGDTTMTPLVIWDLSHTIQLPNPVTVNDLGFGPAFIHDTLDQVAWSGGGLNGTFESYRGMKDVATAAEASSESSANSSAQSAQSALDAADNAATGAAVGVQAQLAATAQEATDAKTAAQQAAQLVNAPADTVTAALVGNPATATGAALSAAYAPVRTGKPMGKRLAAIGDSITGFNGSMETQNPGWLHRLVTESMGKIRLAGLFATGGWTLEQIETDHLPSVLALNPRPGSCIIFGGTNNTGANSGNDFNFTTAKATLNRIITALEAGGVKPILVLIPPRDFSQLLRDNVAQWNAHIAQLAGDRGYPIFDAWTPLQDGSGKYKTGYSTDMVHPTELGYDMISKYAIANGFLDNFTDYRRAPNYNTELIANGRFTADANADGLADSWSVVPTNDVTKNAPSIIAAVGGDLLKGGWQQTLLASGVTGWLQQGLAALGTTWAIGDTIEVTARIQTEGVLASGANFGVGMLFTGFSSGVQGIYQWKRDVEDGLFRMKTVIPAGTTGAYFRAYTSGTSAGAIKLRLGEVSVRNLSRTIY